MPAEETMAGTYVVGCPVCGMNHNFTTEEEAENKLFVWSDIVEQAVHLRIKQHYEKAKEIMRISGVDPVDDLFAGLDTSK